METILEMLNDVRVAPCVENIEIENMVLDILGDEITKGNVIKGFGLE